MATLTNTKIKDTYVGLLKTSDNETIDAAGVTLLEDGDGNASALSVGRANNGVTITGTATATAFAGPLTGNVIGNVTGNLTGTVLTAAQANITSVGTLTGLTVSADATVNSLRVGRGAGNISTNTAIGSSALAANTTGAQNTAVGLQALFSNTTGANNTATGLQALRSNTTGANNTATGLQALFANTTGASNTAVGKDCLGSNTTGASNTAVGQGALDANTTASFNTAVGKDALGANTTGATNTALGNAALLSNTTGADNAAVGRGALQNNTTGGSNTATGRDALFSNTTGLENTAIGKETLYQTTTGTDNTAVGINAGTDITSGSNNLLLGNSAGRSTSPSGILTSQSNRICLGDSNITNAHVQVAFTVPSDARDKTNFSEVPHGLDFVSQLQPISYQFKESRDSDVAVGDTHYGFKAQDVLALEGDNSVIVNNKNEDKLGFKESNLIPILVNAIKELKGLVQAQQAEIELLKTK